MTAAMTLDYDEARRVLTVTGEIDDDAVDAFTHALEQCLASELGLRAVDLDAVTYLPSRVIGVLVTRIVNANPQVELIAGSGTIAGRILKITAIPHLDALDD